MPQPFVHLRLHTEFSMTDGLVLVKPLVKTCAKLGMPAVAVTDQGNFCAAVKFYKAANDAGVKPILGVDAWLRSPDLPDGLSRVVFLCMSQQGYKNLTVLISRGYMRNQLDGRAIIERDWLPELAEGLIVLSGGREGEIGQALLAGDGGLAAQMLGFWNAHFHNRFYLELQRTGRPDEERYIHAVIGLAQGANTPVVATNDVRFIAPEDFEAHEVRVCIADGRVLDDPRRPRLYSDQQYLRTPEEMAELFSDIPEALENSLEIAKRCSAELRLGKYFLPNFPVPDGMTIDEFFRAESEQGLEARLDFLIGRDDPEFAEKRKRYDERLDIEINCIIQMGFPGYFLIVADFIQWAKNNGVPVGPGRGSGAGSLVAYALKITDLDPLAYDLLFERFLNPERVSMPDFDVDFCMDGRDRVIDYVAQKYGRESVSQIMTFGTMAAKAVIRDVGRVLGQPYGMVDKLSKLIPTELDMTLDKAYEQEEQLRQKIADDENVREIWEYAKKLEGVTRNSGKHAGGVVISPGLITDFAPLYTDGQGGGLVTQFDKDDVESAGLVKFDFLGLRTLTIIDWALDTINTRRRRVGDADIDIARIPLDDAGTFELLKKFETTAVFQLESRGMKDLIRRLQPSTFEDIVALVALFRPGPLESGMVEDFINRKHGRAEVAYPTTELHHPDLEPVLRPTYGVIVYQEQVMQIAQVLGGYSLGGADMLRRAMGKKKPEEMAKQRITFVEGARAKGIPDAQSGGIFDLMEKFAGYGFNKSHSAAYAYVSYQTAWLKRHYPSAFMAAVLSADMANTDKVVTLIEECRAMGRRISPPDVNTGLMKFTVDDEDVIVYGIGAIRGVGENAIENLIAERRAQGRYRDLFDFCNRVDLRKVNRRVLEALIKAGAMDKLGPSRAGMMASLDSAIAAAEQRSRDLAQGQNDLFGGPMPGAADSKQPQFVHGKEWPEAIRLQNERETLGLYLTGHPIDRYLSEVRRFARNRIADLVPTGRGKNTWAAGLVVATRTVKTKKGDNLGIVTLDDRSGRIDVVAFGEAYETYRDRLVKDAILVVEGEVSTDDFNGGLRMSAAKIMDIIEARERFAEALWLELDGRSLDAARLARLEAILEPFRPGSCAIKAAYRNAGAACELVFGNTWRVRPADELILRVEELLGPGSVTVRYG
ncbi:MAG: DNA polymerase III subunit alpha [Gammaproteobacteria bacterium]|nr:DNA polymerase III subunit alpha [Gammaproteobacteria bacterium]